MKVLMCVVACCLQEIRNRHWLQVMQVTNSSFQLEANVFKLCHLLDIGLIKSVGNTSLSSLPAVRGWGYGREVGGKRREAAILVCVCVYVCVCACKYMCVCVCVCDECAWCV